jgi:hypothetical protein
MILSSTQEIAEGANLRPLLLLMVMRGHFNLQQEMIACVYVLTAVHIW